MLFEAVVERDLHLPKVKHGMFDKNHCCESKIFENSAISILNCKIAFWMDIYFKWLKYGADLHQNR